jgi:cytosine/adenosine deaminase-related metal-dependent hydrolase
MKNRRRCFVNATIPGHAGSTLRIEGDRIAGVGAAPKPGDAVIDLDGDQLLPGLINAHDHLELNNFARLKWRRRYANVRQWIEDYRPHLESDPQVTLPRSVPLGQRLLIGGLKNLLSGVTTVAHHNSLYRPLLADRFPVRVVRRYGWAHSLLLSGERDARASHRRTPAGAPWIIHLGEGIDAEAAAELSRLDALGCLQQNTVIVHGVGLSRSDHARIRAAGAGLIWCPTSNLFLFGKTAAVGESISNGRVALGSDSRLTGKRDLLDELIAARSILDLDEGTTRALVTINAARLLRLADRGDLRPGASADLLILPAGASLGRARRRDVRLVVIGGKAKYGAPAYFKAFDWSSQVVASVRVDGRNKLITASLAARLRQSSIAEPGLELRA